MTDNVEQLQIQNKLHTRLSTALEGFDEHWGVSVRREDDYSQTIHWAQLTHFMLQEPIHLQVFGGENGVPFSIESVQGDMRLLDATSIFQAVCQQMAWKNMELSKAVQMNDEARHEVNLLSSLTRSVSREGESLESTVRRLAASASTRAPSRSMDYSPGM